MANSLETEAIRCLKRNIAQGVFNLLRIDRLTAQRCIGLGAPGSSLLAADTDEVGIDGAASPSTSADRAKVLLG